MVEAKNGINAPGLLGAVPVGNIVWFLVHCVSALARFAHGRWATG